MNPIKLVLFIITFSTVSVFKNTTTTAAEPVHREITVLCYHNIKASAKGHNKLLTISSGNFRKQIKMLSDSGYHTILPDQLLAYLQYGGPLPEKPVMISFDDTHLEHFSIAAPILDSLGFKGIFFIMTICIGKKGYMSAAQIRALAENGHIIACHTWDHKDVLNYKEKEWTLQLDKTRSRLEEITGKPVKYFGYPYGAWNNAAIKQLKNRGILAAFQLMGTQSETDKLYTIRRLMVSDNWTPEMLQEKISTKFR